MGEQDTIPIRPGFAIPASELRFSFIRSSGPGGQKVNKTATKVRLKWWPGESPAVESALSAEERERLLKGASKVQAEDGSVQLVSERFRTRDANRDACCKKLADLIRAWLKKPKKRRPTAPTRASRERRLEGKRKASRLKESRRKPPVD